MSFEESQIIILHCHRDVLFYGRRRVLQWARGARRRNKCQQMNLNAYEPFFHRRAMNRPVSPERTWTALVRFRARASTDLRREK